MGFSGQYGTLILYAFHASSVPWFVSCVSILFFTLVTLHSRPHRDTPHTRRVPTSAHVQIETQVRLRRPGGGDLDSIMFEIRSAQEPRPWPRQSSMSAETGGPSELRIVRCVAATARGVSSRVHSATHDTHPVQQQHQNVTPPTTLPRTSTVEGASQLQNPGLTRGSM